MLQQRTDSFSIASNQSMLSICVDSDDTYVFFAAEAIKYLTSNGLTMVKSYWANTTSTDINLVQKAVQTAMINEMTGVEADISWYFICI